MQQIENVCVTFHMMELSRYSLILVGEGSHRGMENADADDPSLVAEEAGLSAWKLLSEDPHLEKLATIYQDTSRVG